MRIIILLLAFLFITHMSSMAQVLSLDSILTPEEISWLNEHEGRIKYAPDPRWPPIEYLSADSIHSGIIADYIRLVEAKLGVRFERIYYDGWTDVLNALERGDVYFAGSVQETEERKQYLNFTEPLFRIPTGIIAKDIEYKRKRNSENKIESFAVAQSYATIGYIEKNFPDAKIIECKDNLSAFSKVAFEEADATIIDLMTGSHLIYEHGIQNLVLVDEVDFQWEIGIGVEKSQHELYSILVKIVNSISEQEHDAIMKKWRGEKTLHVPDFFERNEKVIIFLFAFVLLLFLLVVGINLTLRKLVADRTHELQEAMKALAAKEEQYRILVDNQTDFIIKLDLNGRFQFVSKSFCKVIGKNEKELLGTSFQPLVHADDVAKTYDAISRLRVFPYKSIVAHRAKTVDGLRWIEWYGRALFDEQKNVTGVISIGRDITEKKAFEIDLINAKDHAEESDRLKSAFLANISHEIRTPMNSIMGFASLMPEEEDKKRINEYARIIYSNSELLVHIIDDIVLYSRLQSKSYKYEPRTFNVCDLLDEIKQTFALPEYQQNVELLTENKMKCPKTIQTDYGKIKQVLVNLTGNAFKYTASGTILIGAETRGSDTVFYVKDTGIGIPSEEKNKVFHRFFRGSNTKRETISGTGLGLSIVKELVTLLDGDVWVESEEGKGSSFYVKLRGDENRISEVEFLNSIDE